MEVFDVYSSNNEHFNCVICKDDKCFGLDKDDSSEYSTIEDIISALLKGYGWPLINPRWDAYVGYLIYTITKQSRPEYFI